MLQYNKRLYSKIFKLMNSYGNQYITLYGIPSVGLGKHFVIGG